ncbi:MAG: AbrB/MazE/SpoVT family DNA-binding domain-containing protein [Acidobacteria bacterium]|nr:AbrB/MazE/SpoVT family DNA-binding domain-containing protein [Acidobacteriota bacterium]
METKIQRWGNSLGLRIPKSFAAEAHVEAGSTVDIAMENGEILVRPLRRHKCDLASLVRAISVKNLHDAVETGAPVGREAW